MADMTSVRVELTLPKVKLRKLKEFLNNEGGKVVARRKAKNITSSEDAISIGNYHEHEKPSDFAGIWKDDDRSIEEVRRKAWDNRGIKW